MFADYDTATKLVAITHKPEFFIFYSTSLTPLNVLLRSCNLKKKKKKKSLMSVAHSAGARVVPWAPSASDDKGGLKFKVEDLASLLHQAVEERDQMTKTSTMMTSGTKLSNPIRTAKLNSSSSSSSSSSGPNIVVVVNFPHNPTGILPSHQEWGEMVSLCRDAGAYLFSDEMYREWRRDEEDKTKL